jgi:drug/metabolite transporter (DMT)-like permease
MNVLDHTTHWYRGEIFEATIMAIVGMLFVSISLVFWKLGKTPNTQAMVIPILVIGLLLGSAGIFMSYSNNTKLKSLSVSIENQQKFAEVEKQRVEDFQSLYVYTKIGAALFFIMAIILLFATKNSHWQAIAIALIITGVSGIIIDYFSEERANAYYNELLKIIR